MELLEKQVYELEIELLKPETRRSQEKISELLSVDFIEFCSSGDIYHYIKGDVFESDFSAYEIKDSAIKELSEDCILATYKIIKHSEINECRKYSLRSSIWKKLNGTWKMIFHQGTLTS